MKYLWLIFLLCVVGLVAQVKLAGSAGNAFADGELACVPVPPRRERAEPPLLPAPVLQRIPPLAQPVRVEATSIEIFDNHADANLVETRLADNVDWGLPRSLPADEPVVLAYAVEPRLVEPVPVNVVERVEPRRVAVEDLISTGGSAWSPVLERWNESTMLTMLAAGLRGDEQRDVVEADGVIAAATDKVDAASGNTFYLPPAKVETASLEPKKLTATRSGPNLYLPAGALDEEGAMLTLIKPELKIYELPEESAAWSGEVLKAGDKVRPLTRLRNAEGFDWIKLERDGKSYWAQAEYFIRVDPRNRRQFPEGNLAVGQESVDKDSALPVDYKPDDLVALKQEYVFGAKEVQLRKEAAEAFERMAAEAKRQGHTILAFSGFRDFDYQKRLYLDAVEKGGPKQDGTAAPGYSEHQLGTTADICGDNRRTILSGKFGDTPEGRWLHNNSEKFGFRKSYTTENSEEVGYKPEPWHFRYIGVAQNISTGDVAGK